MKYSFNIKKNDVIFAGAKDINASFKDLGAVCDAIRYRSVGQALSILDGVVDNGKAIEFRKHNKYMGSRHELGGKKGRFPKRCAAVVRKVLINASANARNRGYEPDSMFVVHAAANKTLIFARMPPKGVRVTTTGGYGPVPYRRSNLELARVEIGLSSAMENSGLGRRMRRAISSIKKHTRPVSMAVPKKQKGKKSKTEKPAASIKKEKTTSNDKKGEKKGA